MREDGVRGPWSSDQILIQWGAWKLGTFFCLLFCRVKDVGHELGVLHLRHLLLLVPQLSENGINPQVNGLCRDHSRAASCYTRLHPSGVRRAAFCRVLAGTTSCTSGHACATPGGWHCGSGSHFTFYHARVLIFVHLAFVPILILSFDLVGPAAAHAPSVGSQKLPPLHMYCRSVLSSCRREAAQCGAVRGGAKRSDSETKGFEEQSELEALSVFNGM